MKRWMATFSLLFLTQCSSEKSPSHADYLKGIEAGTTLGLDVRSIKEIDKNGSPRALHIPMGSLLKKMKSLDKNKTILVFCESGGRATLAKGLLKARGFKKVINIRDWRTWNQILQSKSH